MAGYKFILGLVFLCSCLPGADANLDFFNNSDTTKIIDWSGYDRFWSENMNNNSILPTDMNYIDFPADPIEYVFLHPVQKYIQYNGTMYSNTNSPIPITGFKKGYRKYDSFHRTDIEDKNHILSCLFVCQWTETKTEGEETKKEPKLMALRVRTAYYNTTKWNNLTNNITIQLTNYTSNYLILNLWIPEHVTAYTFTVSSNNHTSFYQKYEYLYSLNGSKGLHYYDMESADLMSFDGLIPFGPNRFYLPFDMNNSLSLTVYTPFEHRTYDYPNICIIDVPAEEKEEGNIGYIFFFVGFVIAIYWIYRKI
jgi:hypothetical protein